MEGVHFDPKNKNQHKNISRLNKRGFLLSASTDLLAPTLTAIARSETLDWRQLIKAKQG